MLILKIIIPIILKFYHYNYYNVSQATLVKLVLTKPNALLRLFWLVSVCRLPRYLGQIRVDFDTGTGRCRDAARRVAVL